MAMIEFEDKVRDDRPMPWGTRIFVAFLLVMQLVGCASQVSYIAGLLGLSQ